jgi:hypothetical protein
VPREPHLHRHDGRRDRERDQALDQRPDPTGPASREATCAVTPISAASRNPDTFSALLCQDLLAEALSAAESSEDRCKGGCSLGHPLIPHLSRTTSKIGSDENRPGTEFTGQRHFPTFAAGHGIGPAQPLKVETRVRTPLGLHGKAQVRDPVQCERQPQAYRSSRICPAADRDTSQVTRAAPAPPALAMAFKLIESAQTRWRAVNAPHLVALVRAGAVFKNGKLIERPTNQRVVISRRCSP